MDAPIYIRFVSTAKRPRKPPPLHKQLLFVIEERDGETSAAAGEQLINSGNENERVTILNLPDSRDYSGSSVAVAKSRLFIVGGDDFDFEEGVSYVNGIHSVNLKDDTLSWETNPLDEHCPSAFGIVGGTAFSDDGSLIYGLGLLGNIYAFDTETRTLQFDHKSAVPAPDTSLPRLLAFTDNKLYVNCANYEGDNLLGYYDIKSLTWHTMDDNAARLSSLHTRVVVVRYRYQISFGLWHPVNGEFCPALYVYDIPLGLWLPEPVQGLPHDGNILPTFKSHEFDLLPIHEPSLMQVRRDELKLALFWCISPEHELNEFHLSKFTLTIQENVGQFFPHTFRAESLSSACFSATGLLLEVNCITA